MKKVILLTLILLLTLPTHTTAQEKTLPSNLPHSELTAHITQYIKDHQETTAGLSLAIFAGEDILYEAYHGYADRQDSIPVTKNTVMEWGSTTKVLVWVSVMQLVENGQLSLTADIADYLPEDFLRKLKHDTPLSMYNLMHHNAGWQESMIELFVDDTGTLTDLETTLRKTEPRQIYEPGEYVAYSNWGVALAGYIVECITDKPFYQYVHDHIFQVLGMNHTALNADLSDNTWVRNQRDSLRYYAYIGTDFNIPYIYIPLYPAGMGVGTLSDFLRFAMALVADKTGKSPLFKTAQTLQDFTSTSLYFPDGKTERNSHGLWCSSFSVPVVGHGGNTMGSSAYLQICPSTGDGVVVMTNQAQEGVYNFGIMPLVFGEYMPTDTTNMPDVAGLEGIYQNARTVTKGMLKWYQLMGLMPFAKSADNVLSLPPMMSATQIEPYRYDFKLMDMMLPLVATVTEDKTMLSIPMWDYMKTSWSLVIFKIFTIVLLLLASVYSVISLMITLIRRIMRRPSFAFGTLRMLNDVSVILGFINYMILAQSLGAYMGMEFFFATYASVLIQGISFMILALIPVVFTTRWILWTRTQDIGKKDKLWLVFSSVAGLIMTFNAIYWNLFVA